MDELQGLIAVWGNIRGVDTQGGVNIPSGNIDTFISDL